jgi:hypothetical protein
MVADATVTKLGTGGTKKPRHCGTGASSLLALSIGLQSPTALPVEIQNPANSFGHRRPPTETAYSLSSAGSGCGCCCCCCCWMV